MTEMTTIKVPKALRQRLSRNAAESGVTAAALVAEMLDERDRQARFHQVGLAYAAVDDSYLAELEVWDTTVRDGLG